MDFEQEAKQAENLLKGKVVEKVSRNREKEICIEFTDGTRLFVDHIENSLELSITGGPDK
jgi:hypothetical protein